VKPSGVLKTRCRPRCVLTDLGTAAARGAAQRLAAAPQVPAARPAPSSRRSGPGSCLGSASPAGCTSPTCSTATRSASRMEARRTRMTVSTISTAVTTTRAWDMRGAATLRPPSRAETELAAPQYGEQLVGDTLRLGPCTLRVAEMKSAGPPWELREFVGPSRSLGRGAAVAVRQPRNRGSMQGMLISVFPLRNTPKGSVRETSSARMRVLGPLLPNASPPSGGGLRSEGCTAALRTTWQRMQAVHRAARLVSTSMVVRRRRGGQMKTLIKFTSARTTRIASTEFVMTQLEAEAGEDAIWVLEAVMARRRVSPAGMGTTLGPTASQSVQ
jgi:hypothetical protein